MLDLKVKKTSKYENKSRWKSDETREIRESLRDTERVSGECCHIQYSMRSRDFKQDVLPYVYQIIHP